MNDEMHFNCGLRIKELRKKLKLSQEDLALQSDITTSYLGMIERGEKNPTVYVIEKICYSLNITLADFFTTKTSDNRVIDISNKLNKKDNELLYKIINDIIKFKYQG